MGNPLFLTSTQSSRTRLLKYLTSTQSRLTKPSKFQTRLKSHRTKNLLFPINSHKFQINSHKFPTRSLKCRTKSLRHHDPPLENLRLPPINPLVTKILYTEKNPGYAPLHIKFL